MRYCGSNHIKIQLWPTLDEIRFSLMNLNTAYTYAHDHPEQIIIIEILDFSLGHITWERLNELIIEQTNLYLDFYNFDDYFSYLENEEIEHIRFMYHYPVNTYNMLNVMIYDHPSYVSIAEPLTFDLENVKKAITDYDPNIKLRVMPALGKPALYHRITDDDGLCHFWAVPQMTSFYEPYIDVFDLYDSNATREEALIEFFKKGVYNKELGYFIQNSNSNFIAGIVDEDFIKKRLNCKQTCLQGLTNTKCHYCKSVAAISKIAKKEVLNSFLPN